MLAGREAFKMRSERRRLNRWWQNYQKCFPRNGYSVSSNPEKKKNRKSPPIPLLLLHSPPSGFSHSPSAYHHILRRLLHTPLVSQVPRFTDLIRTHKCPCTEDIALTVIKTYTKNRMTDRAFNGMGEVFGCEAGVRSFNSLLNAFAEAKQWDKAEAFFCCLFPDCRCWA